MKSHFLPGLPNEVDVDHLGDDYFLYSAADRKTLLEKLDLTKDEKISKKTLQKTVLEQAQYSVIIHDGELYALYLGRKHRKHAGAGSFGLVKYIQNLRTGAWLVVKYISRFHLDHNEVKREYTPEFLADIVSKEFTALQMFNLVYGQVGARHSGQHGVQYYLIIRAAPGRDLFDWSVQASKKAMHPQHLLEMFKSFCDEVAAFHADGGVHRDIKLENTKYHFGTNKISLIDFSFALKSALNKIIRAEHMLGTCSMLAPEAFAGNYSTQSDEFAVGATLADFLNILIKRDDELRPSKLQSRESSNCFYNLFFPDRTIFRQVYELCAGLMAARVTDRIDLQAAITMIHDIQKSIKDNPVKVGILDVKSYLGLTAESQQTSINALLAECHEVALLAPEDAPVDKRIYKFKRQLQAEGCKVYDQLFHTSCQDIKQELTRQSPHVQRVYQHFSWAKEQVVRWSLLSGGRGNLKALGLFPVAQAADPHDKTVSEKRLG